MGKPFSTSPQGSHLVLLLPPNLHGGGSRRGHAGPSKAPHRDPPTHCGVKPPRGNSAERPGKPPLLNVIHFRGSFLRRVLFLHGFLRENIYLRGSFPPIKVPFSQQPTPKGDPHRIAPNPLGLAPFWGNAPVKGEIAAESVSGTLPS
ncbi:hypothetical protein JTE90_007359 [Oedothorax gibbosus]|uniref:Uncharacterized protein n=1 Tax=Oedothorax gibbosus TaxID=931172 RepID=A0AAV6TFV4_9ARAC|nr:hypothetical protein JTE90_007359 [Oedothorax gibbosus]